MKNNDDSGAGVEFVADNWMTMVRVAQKELYAKGCAAPAVHAEDIAASVRIKLLEHWPELTSPVGSLYVFTANLARNHARKCRREGLAELDDRSIPLFSQPGQDPEQIVEAQEFIQWALSQLNEKEKEIIVRRFFLDLSFQSIAQMLGVPLGTITSAYSRALKKIKAAMDTQQTANNSTTLVQPLDSQKGTAS